MRATISLLVTSLLFSLLGFDYQAFATDVSLSISSSQQIISAKPSKPSKPPYRGSGRKEEPV
jgi:hypothetical protein